MNGSPRPCSRRHRRDGLSSPLDPRRTKRVPTCTSPREPVSNAAIVQIPTRSNAKPVRCCPDVERIHPAHALSNTLVPCGARHTGRSSSLVKFLTRPPKDILIGNHKKLHGGKGNAAHQQTTNFIYMITRPEISQRTDRGTFEISNS